MSRNVYFTPYPRFTRSGEPRAAITQIRWPTKYTKEILKQILKNVGINIPNDM
jgi:hypothetical protein